MTRPVDYNVCINDDPIRGPIFATSSAEAARLVAHLAALDETITVVTRQGTLARFERFGLGVRRKS